MATSMESERRNGAVIARLPGPRITNVNEVRRIGEELRTLLEEEKPTVLVLDFSKVNYLPSAMLGKLGALRTKVREADCLLKLVGLQEPVQQLFSVTHLDKIFDIYETEEEAFAN